MNICEMTRKDFDLVRKRGWDENIGEIYSLIILPERHKHDSGYRCMSFVACDKVNNPICKCGGCTDDLAIGIQDKIYFSMDCLPKSGLLHLWSDRPFSIGSDLSTISIQNKNQ